MLLEKAAQVALAEAKLPREPIHAAVVKCTGFDQRERSRDGVRGSAPGGHVRSRFGTAAKARPEAGGLSRCRSRVERHVLPARRPHRTDGPTIDARRPTSAKEAAIESGISRTKRPIAGVVVQVHSVS